MELDLPALERPQKATSVPVSTGHWDSFAALFINAASFKGKAEGLLDIVIVKFLMLDWVFWCSLYIMRKQF